jgi:thiosulfate dehydrogenase
MTAYLPKLLKTAVIVLILGGLYLLAVHKHAEREARRQAAVELTPGCKAKLEQYALTAEGDYRSPYLLKTSGRASNQRGYSVADVRAIQRGCNIVDDMLGQLATDGARARWNSSRFSRSQFASCDHCHQGLGDKQDAAGNRLVGSNGLAASWVMADMYDRFTGLLLPYEMRQMQCYINSSNGFKPNAADDLLRDVTAYSRFLAAALDLRIGKRYRQGRP